MSQDFTTNNGMITAAFAQQFHDAFDIESQQKESRFVQAVYNRGKIQGYSFTVNDMASIEMEQVTGRFEDTKWSVPETGSRLVTMADYGLHVPIEPRDLPKLLADPQGAYMSNLVAANNRLKDKVIYRGLLDAIKRKTSQNGAYSDAVLPAAQKILAGGEGITKAKIIKAKALFRKNECDEKMGEKLYIAYNADMLETILNDTTLTSADFLKVEMLQDGAVATNWLGFNWVPYEALDSAEGVYTTVAWCSSAAHFGAGNDYKTDVGVRRDKNNAIQISVMSSYGAGRANEKKVVAIEFAE
ncbi:phage capsid protein [Entomomonas sp. E2T0]|uniref:phage capsid protein n=1 Tax=Entomomonas sp. E2T0 TaxID=2930213 RepID=UPI0022281340|nr:phage capsid protein [Entomomonas sp. E2T0]UYZ82822.1 phage capsid protein [Entomomonas sp. E2T0]